MKCRSSLLVGLVCAVALVLPPSPALADNVDTLIGQLERGSEYKIRLSAALSLAKLADARAIPSFIRALAKDSDKTVRGAAAVGLSKLVDGSTNPKLRGQAVAALEKAANDDAADFVRKQAEKSLGALKELGGGGSAAPTPGGIFVDLGQMSAQTPDAARMKALMRKTAEKAFGKNAKDMALTWRGGKAPTRNDLATAKTSGFHVDGTLTELAIKEKGASTLVSCKINMLIASYPEKSMFGFLNGGASVQASNSASDVELAKEDCVVAVVEDLVAKKIVPTIKARSGQ